MRFRISKGLLCLFAAASLAAQAAPIAFSFSYLDGVGEGFNDPVYGAAARSALEFAGVEWGSYLSASYTGETIHVDVVMDSLGAGSTLLATGGPIGSNWNYAGMTPNTLYAAPLANHIEGRDLGVSDEIHITFNSDRSFYFGTDFNAPKTQYDFVSLAMHEMGHGLGFTSRIDHDASDGTFGEFLTSTSSSTGLTNQYPAIYDRFLADAATGGTLLVNMTDAQRAVAITSGSLYWTGAHGVAANGGMRPELYAPASPEGSSSVVHFDPSTHFLLDPNLAKGEDVVVDAVTLGVLADMGWTIAAVPEPGTYAMLIAGLVVIARRSRSRPNRLTASCA